MCEIVLFSVIMILFMITPHFTILEQNLYNKEKVFSFFLADPLFHVHVAEVDALEPSCIVYNGVIYLLQSLR